jgi:hypothetical protein
MQWKKDITPGPEARKTLHGVGEEARAALLERQEEQLSTGTKKGD